MKTAMVVIAALVVIALGYFAFLRKADVPEDKKEVEGSVNISFTDQTAEIANVNEIRMQVDKVELYSETKGWVKVSDNDAEYKLLALKAKGESRVYATANVAADTYTKTRVTLKKVAVDTKTKGEKAATLPKKAMEISGNLKVEEGKTSSVHIDVLADQSLHTASNGSDYVFAPVVKVENRSNATVNTSSEGVVVISGGSVDSSLTSGMDLDGSMKANFKLDSNVKIDLSTGIFKNNGDEGESTSSDDSVDVNVGGVIKY